MALSSVFTFRLVLIRPRSGGDGIRTHCLYIANVALYQLSYTPEEVTTLAQGPAGLCFATPAGFTLWLVELVVVLVG